MINRSDFKEGSVLYFEPFIFQDGGTPKSKYFIVLKHTKESILLASLPTSKDHIPFNIAKRHGCLNDEDINFNCYYFNPNVEICTNGFSFPLETYVYGFRLQMFDMELLIKQETDGQTKITHKGNLIRKEFNAIVQCLAHSNSVKRKYRNILL